MAEQIAGFEELGAGDGSIHDCAVIETGGEDGGSLKVVSSAGPE